jgi:hypothetical protein
LIGLETEYAIRIQHPQNFVSKPSFDFDQFSWCLEQEVPWARSFRNSERLFLANGGCLSLEHGSSMGLKDILLESATPECKSPRELLVYQVALERLLSDALHQTNLKQDAQLMKGNADAHGHTYGQHESYDVRIATGWRLLGWRAGLLALLPCLIAYKFLAAIWIFVIWILGQATLQATLIRSWLAGGTKSKVDESTSDPPEGTPKRIVGNVPPWWMRICAYGLRAMHLPLASALWLNIYLFALIPHRRHLAAFFASRCIIDGAGHLDPSNRFWISVRAASVNSLIGFGSYRHERPIFRCDSWLRGLCMDPFWRLSKYCDLFRSTQRVEIAIGDSGLCEQSQYVRIGATALVLDLVEKSVPNVPHLKNCLDAILRFSKDWMLLTSVSDRSRKQWTALDIQHAYASAVRQLLQSQSSVPVEAWRILDQWQTTLNQLHPTDDESNLPRNMLGRIDWLSKLWLLHQMRAEVSWQVRKKIDLRYHELSRDGYYERLMGMLGMAPLLDQNEIARARRSPPQGTPATQRGYIIREFSDSSCNIRCDWKRAEFYFEDEKRTIRF